MTTSHYVTMNINDPDISYIQSRAEMNFDQIDEYAQQMRDGIIFDAIEAIIDTDGHNHVYNGAHRIEAAKKAGVYLQVKQQPGTKAEAEWLALGANTNHGLQRSNATKQRVTKNALLTRPELSNREIAKHCQVDHKTVGKLRKDLEASGEIPQIDERTVTRNGQTFTQTAKAEPKYIPIWQLEQGTTSWLEKKQTTTDFKIEVLAEIKRRSKRGNDFFAALANYQQTPHRKSDLRQAANNVLDQMSQTAKAEPTGATCAICETSGLKSTQWLHSYTGKSKGHPLCLPCWRKEQAEVTKAAEAKATPETIAQTEPPLDFLCTDCATTDPGGDYYWPGAGPALCQKCRRKRQKADAPPTPDELQPPEATTCATCETNQGHNPSWAFGKGGKILCQPCYRAEQGETEKPKSPWACHCGGGPGNVLHKGQWLCGECWRKARDTEAATNNGDQGEAQTSPSPRTNLNRRFQAIIWAVPDKELPTLDKWIEAMEYKHHLTT